MGFLEDALSGMEPVMLDYKHTDRFIHYIPPFNKEPFHMKYEIDMMLDKELEMWKNGTIKPPMSIFYERELKDYSIDVWMSLYMCMRLTNVNKAIYLLLKLGGLRYIRLCNMFQHINKMLQEECQSIYGQNYDVKIYDMNPYIKGSFKNDPFVLYLIRQDLPLFFESQFLRNQSSYEEHKREFMECLCYVYSQIEVEMMIRDINHKVSEKRKLYGFEEYYNYKNSAKNVINEIGKNLDTFRKDVNFEAISKMLIRHEIITI